MDERLSNLVQLHMACPQCHFALKVPKPQFDAVAAAAAAARRLDAEDLAAS